MSSTSIKFKPDGTKGGINSGRAGAPCVFSIHDMLDVARAGAADVVSLKLVKSVSQ
jgi:hypothetical protein